MLFKNLVVSFFLNLFLFGYAFGFKHFVLVSAPGSGKGTMAQYLVKKYNYIQICPGDIYRHEIQKQTELGKIIQPVVDRGDYVEEEITCALMSQHILAALDQDKHFIVDGFPRTQQAFLFLKDLFNKHGLINDVCFIQFLVSDECCISRVCDRQVCTECFRVYNTKSAVALDGFSCDDCGTALTMRKADTYHIMLKRLNFFHTNVEPLIKMAANLYHTKMINTGLPVEKLLEVYDDLVAE